MIKLDIHNHLGRSGENPGFDETIDYFYHTVGSDSVFGIANSDDYRYEDFVNQAGGRYTRQEVAGGRAIYVPEVSVLVVKCQEMFTKQGDVLAIAMPKGKGNVTSRDAKFAIKSASDLGAILDAVHPFYAQGIGKFLEENPNTMENFSTFEVYNASAALALPPILPRKANRKALYFYGNIARECCLGMNAATDGHSVESLGRAFTFFPTGPQGLSELVDLPEDDFLHTLDIQFRDVVSLRYLYRKPNRKDAFKHAVDLAMGRVRTRLFF